MHEHDAAIPSETPYMIPVPIPEGQMLILVLRVNADKVPPAERQQQGAVRRDSADADKVAQPTGSPTTGRQARQLHRSPTATLPSVREKDRAGDEKRG